ncbi:putative manganese-dependent inorganic diphosphatase [Anaerocolumna xylanovorans]|uniref:inorganic diphosphatase n=1 Tax=Anaerocolumna xylanovorans DSM 12503 TaxID=1121345 RepID=A0A1M7YKA2_9FIRM|nr:putative manganese-dependent inorganic diphosphatase [Anaerocolumna xylanovorans]SHO53027.1 manganese-dependent inorganic pyrophosphatase [Anaerocolumna xylanovorans DSM 12503]
MGNQIFVIGHVNPDTDSICSAIAYANLKSKLTGEDYVPKRAGHINSETKFVLEAFKASAPAYLPDVRTQVKDIEVRRTKGVEKNISLKEAWSYMRKNNVVTLPIVDTENHLEGLITVGDITKSYMDVYDNRILTKAHTPCRNLVETLEGELLVGSGEEMFREGKVLIAAANPDLMENYIEKDDVVILGNRYESQLCAIEMNAGCIIVCDGASVSKTITRMAQNNNCIIIKTPYDTFTAARLINQSIPIQFFMTDKDILFFTKEDYIEDIKGIMAQKRHRDFPILDKDGHYFGMISRRNLLGAKRKQIILVDHNEKSQAVDGLEDAEILEIIDHHRLGSLETINPVFFRNQPLGCTATIIYQMYQEHQIEIEPKIAGLLCAAILSDTLVYRSPTCTEADKQAAQALALIAGIQTEEFAGRMFAAGSDLTNKSPEEIFYQDFKKFTAGEVTFGVGQISSMSREELDKIKESLVPYMQKAYHEHGVEMLFFMLTSIMDSSTEFLYQGAGAKEMLINTFHFDKNDKVFYLENVVSRKKQVIPALMLALQEN